MTAMNHYLADTRMSELRESHGPVRRFFLSNLIMETGQVVKGALLPVSGRGASLGQGLQKDLGLR